MAAVDLSKYDNFFFDCDGVLWTGSDSIPGSLEALQYLESLHKRIYFVTNNASSTRKEVAARIKKFGFSCTPKQVFSSGTGTCVYLKQRYPQVRAVFLIGQAGFKTELESFGFRVVHNSQFPKARCLQDVLALRPDPSIDAVVIGSQMSFDYQAAYYASLCVQRGAHLLASNKDPYLQLADGVHMLGCGVFVAFVECATNCTAEVVGKPSPFLMQWAAESEHLDLHRSLMLGDMMDSDVQFAVNAGLDCALLLSGVSTVADAAASRIKPTYILPSLSALLPTP